MPKQMTAQQVTATHATPSSSYMQRIMRLSRPTHASHARVTAQVACFAGSLGDAPRSEQEERRKGYVTET